MPAAEPPTQAPPRRAVVIPARYGSTRFPGKPLARQTGKFLIQHVVEQAQKSRLADLVLVATNDHRIFDAVRGFGGQAVMTSDAHQSGTDRIAKVMRRPEYARVHAVVNVQGDEPDIDPGLIDSLLEALDSLDVPMATASAPFSHEGEVANPNLVKVVADQRQFALYFSRSIMPHSRDHHGMVIGAELRGSRRHLGIYAYRRDALLGPGRGPGLRTRNSLEKLEQLQPPLSGHENFRATRVRRPIGVDTPNDYVAFVKRYNQLAGHGQIG